MKNLKIVLVVFAVSGLLAVYRGSTATARFQYVVTAHQAGPVGFRDPFGSVSPDGQWVAFVSNRHLYLHRIEGASTTEFGPADNGKAAVRWFPDSLHFAVM